MKHCQWCDANFETKISYQIYCSPSCRESATKEKISARYLLTRRTKRSGKIRKCKQCDSQLSIYNDEELCNKCEVNPKDVFSILKDIKGLANGKN
jgi:RecJ-like exonuclease